MARILVVDDAAFMRHMISQMVAGIHEVTGEAANGREAIQKYKELRPDIVTMDITMPDMQGIEAVREIIAYDPKAVILMCSAMGNREAVLTAIKSGAKDFITKPLQKERLLEAIDRWIT